MLNLIVIYLGFIAGSILAYFTKEELPTGKRYFRILQVLLFALVLCVFLLPLGIGLVYKMLILVGVVGIIKVLSIWIPCSCIIYSIFPILLFFSDSSPLLPSLMFLYGLPSGSLVSIDNINNKKPISALVKKMIISAMLFFTIGLVLFINVF